MRLTDMEPRWIVGSHTPDRAIGVSFACPACRGHRIPVPFKVPIDTGPLAGLGDPDPWGSLNVAACWDRDGETFETLTLRPSVLHNSGGEQRCTWHGFITNGAVVTC